MKFFVGLHQPSDCRHFERSFVSINRLRNRKSNFEVGEWIMDSGAFTEISTHGHYRHDVSEYGAQINRWKTCGTMLAAVSQDWMCEPFIIQKTELSVREHQIRTFHRWQALKSFTDHYVMPVLQGFLVADYLAHLEQYGYMLKPNDWVGVGSVCKRNSNVRQVEEILMAIKDQRPDLRLHGFGLKTTALQSERVWNLLYSADSMAWSFAARKSGRCANDWREAKSFEEKINSQSRYSKPMQLKLPDFL